MKPAAALRLLLLVVLFCVVYMLFRSSGRKPSVGSVASPTAPSAPAKGAASATRPQAAAARPKLTVPKAAPKQKGEVVVKGAWGDKPGQFGRKRDPEANPEMPMAMIAGPNGEVDVLDQVNRRVQRFSGGKLIGSLSTGGDTLQDLAAGPDGRTLLLDRLADQNVQVYDSSGKLVNEVALVGGPIKEGGEVTGVFADDQGTYVEADHGTLVRIADANGQADPNRPELVGRPTKDGRLLVSAAISGRGAGEVTLSAFDRQTSRPEWTQPVTLGEPILHIVMLDSDRQGMIYLAGDVGEESSTPPYTIQNEQIVVVRLSEGGDLRGVIAIPFTPTGDENFRPMSVGDDGAVYLMVATDGGMSVMRYTFQ